jgi:hypothetical protein
MLAIAGLLIGGCQAPGVGDPCTPESVPEGGFVSTEAYLETSSVQCRTRVCMVYKLSGIPNTADDPCPADQPCASPPDTEARVYCTCRCDAPADSTASLCECPDDYTCEPVIESAMAGPGVQGSYCVRTSTITPD